MSLKIKKVAPPIDDAYPESDSPWTFYFNGEAMPKWGACWAAARLLRYLDLDGESADDVSARDVYVIYCRIDHVGLPESADPEIFVFVIQEVIHILLSKRQQILNTLKKQPKEVYPGLVEAAFRMRELALRDRCAFWTSGYEADREHLLDRMRRCRLPSDSPEFALPPHLQQMRFTIKRMQKDQARRLHRLAQSGMFPKDLRRRLNEIRVD